MKKLLCAALLCLMGSVANADIVTEFGAGLKVPGTTSYLLLPECHEAVVTTPEWPQNPRGLLPYSCGGDNPTFIGWPVAWEKELGDAWKLRAGWFHYSNWFDGGKDRETHMDVAAVTVMFNWTAWKRVRN